jgi:methionyl aminopeptidase
MENDEMTEEERLKLVEEVGKASYDALLNAKRLVVAGAKLVDVANAAEGYLRKKGFGLAFPLNLSINEIAAHYAPSLEDDRVFSENDVVKVDFGAEKNGILGDCAVTVDLSGKYHELVDAAEAALEAAIGTVTAGVQVNAIGKAIEDTIVSRGFNPVRNLGGHQVAQHDLHSNVFIPNFDNGDDTVLEEGLVIAIEPFATTGKKGSVAESDIHEIYGYNGSTAVRSTDARSVLKEVESAYQYEPFAARWLSSVVPDRFKLYIAIKELVRAGVLSPYPALVDTSNGIVAQAEKEVIVEKGGCKVLTA